jgi:hypothetical protein
MLYKTLKITLYLAIALIYITLHSCQDDSVSTDLNIPLRFSLDTLTFDTVFTEIGSATRSFKVYNDLDQAVIINSVQLDDVSGFFRMNVDGTASDIVENVRIEANDSIYIFAEVTIDPDMDISSSPFIIERFINFTANNSEFNIMVQAWGQNANYIPSNESKATVNVLECPFGQVTWDDPKPYVIYGALLIDNCELIIPEGTQIYVHGGIAITELGTYNDGLVVLLENGKITSNGTAENPVTIQTDRLEEEFSEVQGQWSGILCTPGSEIVLSHTSIENSIVGLSIDSTASATLESCTIAHTAGSAISASNGNITANNSLFYNNGSFGLSLNFGGLYNFSYCTVANYNNQDQAVFLNNFKCIVPDCSQVLPNPLQARFSNCILVGNDDDEIALADITDGTEPAFFDYELNNCIVIVDDLLDADAHPNFFNNCIDCINVNRTDSIFLNPDNFDYRLDTTSVAIDMAIPISGITTDIIGNSREPNTPDIGCYEFLK